MISHSGVELNNGSANPVKELPKVGFGTYRTGGYECFNAVQEALDAGYRHIDTAMAYENEAVVGRAIDVSPVDREDLFLTTKVKGYPEFLTHDRLINAVEGSLRRLDTEYLDLVLVHWWNSEADMEESFDALAHLVDSGKVDSVGVSNFSLPRLRRAIDVSDVPIATTQMQYHPYFQQEELLKFCRNHDVVLTAYSPLAEGRVVDDEVLVEIGQRYGKSAAQVALRWLIQQEGVVTIPKAVTTSHIHENLEVFDFELTNYEMKKIHELEGPLWFRMNSDRGPITRFRSFVGPYVPKAVRNIVG